MTESLAPQSDATNAVDAVVDGFGDEWSRFDQSTLNPRERQQIFDEYFAIFPWESLPPMAIGIDFGCGSGRWAQLVAPRVARLHCVDASHAALDVARRNLRSAANVEFHLASLSHVPLPNGIADFGYSLGVLHHIPNTGKGLRDCVAKLKPGAPFLVYLYYRFDNRPIWFRLVWRASDVIRRIVSVMPHPVRYVVSQIFALTVYWPLARLARMLDRHGFDTRAIPLSYYRDKSFYTMRTDALDRLGTRLESRFTRSEVEGLMSNAGLREIRFSGTAPFWCAVGVKSC